VIREAPRRRMLTGIRLVKEYETENKNEKESRGVLWNTHGPSASFQL